MKDRDRIVGLKIDVDTYQGMKKGVPRLLETLSSLSVKATFYLSVGPDASGLAVIQLLKNPRFLKKMLQTNAPGLYGFRTALYGTLLPSPMIALSFPETVKDMLSQGHEVQFHAWDHRRWQDGLSGRTEDWIGAWLEKGVAAFKTLTGNNPTSFGAPAWIMDDRVIRLLKKYSLAYLSCTRAPAPFVHEEIGIPEIPSNLPCFEEIGVAKGPERIMELLQPGGLHVLPVHAEVEGGIWREPFQRLMEDILSRGYVINTLNEINGRLDKESLPTRKYQTVLLPGRATPCCV